MALMIAISTMIGAETITYTPKDGDESGPIDALVNRNEYRREDLARGNPVEKTASITVDADDIDEPDLDGDVVSFDGLTWEVVSYKPFRQETEDQAGYVLDVVNREFI